MDTRAVLLSGRNRRAGRPQAAKYPQIPPYTYGECRVEIPFIATTQIECDVNNSKRTFM